MAASRQPRQAAARAGKPISRSTRRPSPVAVAAVVVIALAGGFAAWWWWPSADVAPVQDGAAAATLNWLPNGHEIVFARRHDGHADLVVMNDDGTNVRQLTTTNADESDPAYSPDGGRLACVSHIPGATEDILVMNADGSDRRRVTMDPHRNMAPAWSPDGRQIAFVSDRAGSDFDLYRMNADGSGVERLTNGGNHGAPQYSPDGMKLVFQAGHAVYLFDLATKKTTPVTAEPASAMYPAWSPDGSRIAFMTRRNGHAEIFTMSADGTDQRVLVSMPGFDAMNPRWSPDGTRIAFVRATPPDPKAGNASDDSAMYIVVVASGQITRVSK